MGEDPLGRPDGLAPLEVGVARHEEVHRAPGQLQEGPGDLAHLLLESVGRLHPPEAEVGGHLVVPGAPRVELPRQGAHLLPQEPLHQGVDVLVGVGGGVGVLEAGGHGVQPFPEALRLLIREDFGSGQRPHPGPAPPHVLGPETEVHVQAPVQRLHLRSHPLAEAPSPEARRRRLPARPAGAHPGTVSRLPGGPSWASSIPSTTLWRSSTWGPASSPPLRWAAARTGRPKSLMKPSASAWS